MTVNLPAQRPMLDEPAQAIAGCYRVRANDLPLLTSIGLQAFGEVGPRKYGLERREYYQRLFVLNSNIYRITTADDSCPSEANAVGLVAVIPTTKGTYARFAEGQLSQFEFGSREVLPPSASGPRDLYLQALYLTPAGQQRFMRRLLVGLMSSMVEHSRGGIDGSGPGAVRIFGEGVTDAGRFMMNAFGMRSGGRSREGNPVYFIDTSPGNPLRIRTPHDRLNATLQRYATPRSTP
jgi:hypothetical protein